MIYHCSVCEQECTDIRDHLIKEHDDIIGYHIQTINTMTEEELVRRLIVYGFKFTEVPLSI